MGCNSPTYLAITAEQDALSDLSGSGPGATEGTTQEVIAEREELADQRSVPFEMSTPAPGTTAWAMAGPVGSSTRRISLTPEGDVIEVGTLEIAGA